MTKTVINKPSGVEEVELTSEEATQRQVDVENNVVFKQAQRDAVAQAVTDKASGNQKMLDLGLSQAEVDALTK